MADSPLPLLDRPLPVENLDEVTLRLPSDAAYLPVVRVAAAVVADRAGLSHLDIEDLRLALDELVHHVLGDRDGQLDLTIGHREGEVTIRGLRDRSTANDVELSAVLQDAIDAAVDGWTLDDEGPGSFRVVKRRRATV